MGNAPDWPFFQTTYMYTTHSETPNFACGLAVWLSRSSLVSINEVTQRRARLVLGRMSASTPGVTYLSIKPASHVISAWPSLCW